MTWKGCSVVKRNANTIYLAAINNKFKKYKKNEYLKFAEN
jgi:hypothetical protein